MDMEDPTDAKLITDSENTEPRVAQPKSETEDPNLEKLRIDTELPRLE